VRSQTLTSSPSQTTSEVTKKPSKEDINRGVSVVLPGNPDPVNSVEIDDPAPSATPSLWASAYALLQENDADLASLLESDFQGAGIILDKTHEMFYETAKNQLEARTNNIWPNHS